MALRTVIDASPCSMPYSCSISNGFLWSCPIMAQNSASGDEGSTCPSYHPTACGSPPNLLIQKHAWNLSRLFGEHKYIHSTSNTHSHSTVSVLEFFSAIISINPFSPVSLLCQGHSRLPTFCPERLPIKLSTAS